ncbi:MAG TPA: hypothetical protein VF873_05895 [Gemmatimonadales bacterium]
MRRPSSGFASPSFVLATMVVLFAAGRSAPGSATPDMYPDTAKAYGYICKKLPDSSCQSDTSRIFSAAEVAEVTVSYRLRTGTVVTDSFAPGQVEAIFFTMSAADRMLIPYYRRIRGATYAESTRRRLLAAANPKSVNR